MRAVSVKKIASAHKSTAIIVGGLTIFTIFALFLLGIQKPDYCGGKKLQAGKYIFCARVADNNAERMMGLSGVNYLSDNDAMLFVFDQAGRYGIWMKDMKIPIDILWLNSDKKIIYSEKNVSPDSYPKIFYPSNPSYYVIELKSGSIDRLGLSQNYQFQW